MSNVVRLNITRDVHCATADDEVGEELQFPSSHAFAHRDLPDGYELRLRAYRKAWAKCLERVQVRE